MGDVLFVGAGLLTEVVLHGVQAVQVSSLPTLPTALSLKVWWISLWCLKTLLLATQTERQLHERGLCFCSFPLQCLSRPIRFEQTLQCLKNL